MRRESGAQGLPGARECEEHWDQFSELSSIELSTHFLCLQMTAELRLWVVPRTKLEDHPTQNKMRNAEVRKGVLP